MKTTKAFRNLKLVFALVFGLALASIANAQSDAKEVTAAAKAISQVIKIVGAQKADSGTLPTYILSLHMLDETIRPDFVEYGKILPTRESNELLPLLQKAFVAACGKPLGKGGTSVIDAQSISGLGKKGNVMASFFRQPTNVQGYDGLITVIQFLQVETR